MHIALGNDQAGHPLKGPVGDWLAEHGHTMDDHGTDGAEAVDYPPICHAVGRAVATGAADRGIVLGGSGSGEAMVCNKIAGVRATLVQCLWVARICRANNDANVLVLPAKIIAPAMAAEILEVWFATDFAGGRHVPRLEQIAALDRGEPLT